MGRSKDLDSDSYLKETKERFFQKIKIEENGCWKWFGCTNEKYGVIRFKNKNEFAHRFAYAYLKEPIPKGKFVCHSCDNPLCVNPDHLFLGTHKDNMKDATLKRRYAWGEKHYQKKLKESHIEELKILVKSGLSQSEIGKIFDVSQTGISRITRGVNWKYHESEVYDPELLIRCLIIIHGELETYKTLKFYNTVKGMLP